MSKEVKPVDHEVSGTIEKVTVITRRVGNVTKRSNQVIIITTTGERVVGYCSDLILESALESARYPSDNAHLRALSRRGNAVTIGYDFNAKGTTYLDANGKEQVRKDDSNSIRYMNLDELVEENTGTIEKIEIAVAVKQAEMKAQAKGAGSTLALLRSKNVVQPEIEPESENAVNDAAADVLNKGKVKPELAKA